MSFVRRFREIFSYRHVLVAVALGMGWAVVRRIGLIGNRLDGFNPEMWARDIVRCVILALVVVLAVVIAEATVEGRAPPSRSRYLLAFVGALVVYLPFELWVMRAFLGGLDPVPSGDAARQWLRLARAPGTTRELFLLQGTVIRLMVATLALLVYVWLRHARAAEQALDEAGIARADAQRRLLAAQLSRSHEAIDTSKVLDRLGQIEAAYAKDRSRADAMVDELVDFLRAAMPRLHAQPRDS